MRPICPNCRSPLSHRIFSYAHRCRSCRQIFVFDESVKGLGISADSYLQEEKETVSSGDVKDHPHATPRR